MVHARIVPWAQYDDLEELKKWFYPDKLNGSGQEKLMDMRLRAIQRVKSYQSKGSQYLPHVIDCTAQITSAILLDEEKSSNGNEHMVSVRLGYTMSLIRFVNGILDPTQQSQFAIPLHTLAKRVGLSSWFVELRHLGTHEREMPSIDMLRIAAKEALIWLWDHYWNDDELEEEEDSSEEKEEDHTNDEYIERLRQLVRMGTTMKDILTEYRWIWENGSAALIKSSNFSAEEPKGNVCRRGDALSPHEQITAYISKCKELWRESSDKRLFVESCIKECHPIVFQLMVIRVNGFDQEFSLLLINSFQLQQNGKVTTALKRKYPTWNDLEKKILKKFISSINLSMFISQWGSWNTLIQDNPSYLTLWICQTILGRLDETKSNAQVKRKRKKRKQNEFTQEVEIQLRENIDRLSKRYSEADMKLYDLSLVATNSSEVKTKEKKTNAATKAILSDLASLRERMKTSSSTASQSGVIKIWQRHSDWETKPFGIL